MGGQATAPRLETGGAAHRPQRSADTPAGPAGKAAAPTPPRSRRQPGLHRAGQPGRRAGQFRAAHPASAADRNMLRDGRRGARRSHRLDAGLGAAGGEGQRDGEQCGGDDRPQHQHGRPIEARGPAAADPGRRRGCGRAVPRRGYRRARRRRRAVSRRHRARVFSRAGMSSPAASRLKMVSMDASRGSAPARPSAMEPRACVSGWVRLIIITSEVGA